jgi:hypothetical protein
MFQKLIGAIGHGKTASGLSVLAAVALKAYCESKGVAWTPEIETAVFALVGSAWTVVGLSAKIWRSVNGK